MNQAGVHVNQASEKPPLPLTTHQHPYQTQDQPIIYSQDDTNPMVNTISTDIASQLLKNSTTVSLSAYPSQQPTSIAANTQNPNTQNPITVSNDQSQDINPDNINGQDIMDAATAQIITMTQTSNMLPIACSIDNRCTIASSFQQPTTLQPSTTPTTLNNNNTQGIQGSDHDDDDVDDNDSVTEDLIKNYTTEVIDTNEMDTDQYEPITPAETPHPNIPLTDGKVTSLPAQMNNNPTESDIMMAKPIVRVAMLDFDFKPITGEIFQVNNEGHLIRISLTPGTIFFRPIQEGNSKK